MEWRGRRGSNNIEDRRSMRSAGVGVGGLGVVVVLLLGYVFGVDVTPLLEDPGAARGTPGELSQADREAGDFVSVTLADTEEVWGGIFRDQLGRTYQPPTLVLFSGQTASPCGGASGATGPFYCPGDRKAYLDTDFFATLEQRLGASGDFAAAYVVAHEIGHAVQDQLGVLGQANQVRMKSSPEDSNAISVMIELQADCFAGVWAHQAAQRFGSISQGDVEEAINAARRIGDDTLQAGAGRVPQPHTFTHGTSEQRARWFMTGMQSGDIADCDTFGATRL
jgi:predicted metalloprotease